ncbi:golgin candidate 4 [Punica granatum]|uniref:Golgin candidate 4 n=2 Tax=Punica granatum TaxID=22663 RepID=A0A6P8E4H9_PUNGR|nr:golgin candidate 4 [Punica granatum]PKI46342.1 hypothetical protein CRG98_033237 [Punica granatum]
MLSPLSNWRENLEKIALGVQEEDDDEEELEIYGRSNGHDDSSFSDRRNSHSFAHSKSFSPSPMSNGIDSAYGLEIEQCKAEIRRLQESEAEIKALSVNYAALLKEKEDQISRLNKENGVLKHNLDATSAALNGYRNESSKAASSTTTALKETVELSPSQQFKLAAQGKARSSSNGIVPKQDILGNGTKNSAHDYNQGKEKELADLLEEKNRYLAALQAKHDLQLRELKMELEKERSNVADMQLKLQEGHRLKETFQDQLKSVQADKDKSFREMIQMRNELNEKLSEMRRLQMELNRVEGVDVSDVGGLKRVIASLEKENAILKTEKIELETSLRKNMSHSTEKTSTRSLREEVSVSGFPGREELQQSLQNLEKSLEEARRERDKVKKELNRLKQHLLDKESEESEKMDQDSRIIEELRENNERQRAQILCLEKALKQAIASQDEVRTNNNSELQKCKETIDELNRKLASCISTIDAKNMELLNLQTALGQYYAEIEAKEHLERDLALAREESAKLSELLKVADKQTEAFNREKEEILVKLSQAESALVEGNNRVNKLEEDNAKLRRALEQSMTRLNRMSMDSDFLVDRRIVIKLLVTYFQRNHSKEVLDLMVRMLGFSDEDKQRIGASQQGAGKGVVRGVLGFPGRLVGGILGGSSAEAQSNMASENQSFADLWVDFLLKETDVKERKECLEGAADPAAGAANPPIPNSGPDMPYMAPSFSRFGSSTTQSARQFEPFGSEFSTVPLSFSDGTSQVQRPLPRY